MVGEVFEYLQRNFPTALLVNVVHDSLVIDAQAHEADQVADCVMRILRDTPYYMKNLLGVDMTPIDRMEVGCTMGTNWRDMKEVTYE
jgi:DNA polymerase I-like protein with 3'-5' exonuclease and polymerase domains